jgi:hypothetical protein
MIVLTFDSDWAPQFVLDEIVEKLRQAEIKGTFFLTSPYEFKDAPHIERALHPNFMPNSTQGNSVADILMRMKTWYSDAIGSRSHWLYWHAGLIEILPQHGIIYDSSVILPFHPHLEPTKLGRLTRFAVWWSDPVHMMHGLPTDRLDIPNWKKPGLKVFNFHPIHVFLNSKSIDQYQQILRKVDLPQADYDELYPYVNDGYGIGTLFSIIVEYIRKNQRETYFLKDLVSL